MSAPRRIVNALRRRVEFGDLFIFLYLLVFIRQYAWAVADERLAWALTLLASAALWGLHVRAKGEAGERTPRRLWLIVGLPLLAVYALKFAFPDLSDDVLNHRLMQGERGLRGPLFMQGDFFPTIFPFNPASDMLTGVSRHLLGYRLGTIINYLALLFTAASLEKILRPFVAGARRRCLAVLLVVFTEHLLFEVNNYMVDLLALPLLIEATRLALDYDGGDASRRTRDIIRAGLYLGAALALKLTNVVPVAAVTSLFAFQILRGPSRLEARTWGRVLLASALALLPLAPHVVYIFRETGSPVFPMYNKLAGSPFWPAFDLIDPRWGPRGLWEALVWPVKIFFTPERLSELPVYSGRISVGFIAALVCLLLPRTDRRARMLAAALLLGSLLWSATNGYIRYGFYMELLSGVLLVYLAGRLAGHASGAMRSLRLAPSALIVCVLAAQFIAAAVYAYHYEWSMRATFFERRREYVKDLRFVLRDRSLPAFLKDDERALVGGVGAWVVSSVKTNGVEALLRPDVPALNAFTPNYFDAVAARHRFSRALDENAGRRLYSMALLDNLDASLESLKRRRLRPGEVTTVVVPFFSKYTHLHMALIEVTPEPKPLRAAPRDGAPAITESHEPLYDDAFDAAISAPDAPARMRAGQKQTLRIVVRNASDYPWPAKGETDGRYYINAGDIWLDAETGATVNNLDGRATITHDLAPGEELTLPLTITAPAEPGEYVIEIDLVQEGVAWFKEKGSTPLHIKVTVE